MRGVAAIPQLTVTIGAPRVQLSAARDGQTVRCARRDGNHVGEAADEGRNRCGVGRSQTELRAGTPGIDAAVSRKREAVRASCRNSNDAGDTRNRERRQPIEAAASVTELKPAIRSPREQAAVPRLCERV